MISGTTLTTESPQVSFPAESAPLVSVVILAWRLDGQLLECLTSLRNSHDAPPFEVQLVLNGSSDGVRAMVASSVRGAHLTDLAANIGFGGGCNEGAAAARGEYLVFLNDDTIVSPTWLSSLVTAASGPVAASVAASVLLNVDGSIQEAGSRVLQGAGTVQFGKGASEDDARSAGYLADREVDYGSGAALLVSRTAFAQVGGFDPTFEPAYYEDADLCFRLKQAGYPTMLVGHARVTHLSGESTRHDRRFRDFASQRSGSRFIERWSKTLDNAPETDAPLDVLCDPVTWSPVVPAHRPAARNPEATALDLSIAYAGWLNRQLDAAAEELNAAAEELATEQASAVAQERASLSAIETLSTRLADLDSRGALGILKWKAGLAANRRNERKASG